MSPVALGVSGIMYQSSSFVRSCVVAVVSGIFVCGSSSVLPGSTANAGSAIVPVKIDAKYKITLNGFEIGTFRFKSDVTSSRYSVDTDVELSALLGIFQWRGVTRSAGTFASNTPQPSGFLFRFQSSSRSGSVKLGFDKTGVNDVAVLPVVARAPDLVPLQRKHLQGVLDPLSAIVALTHFDGKQPCGRKVEIFDGKQRFDIKLRYSRHVPIAAGRRGQAIVCRVKYTPVGGYRANEQTRAMAANNGIEIAFRRVPSAGLMVPQSVVVPTVAGPAEITLDGVSIKTKGHGKVALAN
jgi:Protein of unknown function (DUF3108)